MSDPLRSDGAHTRGDASAAADHKADARDANSAKIEQLLLVGLDHYFAAHYEQAINVWTRALFLDRNHARARAYIERARGALAERQRESEELLRSGVAAFDRGEPEEARRLLQAAIEGGAPAEEALAVLERINRLETPVVLPAPAPPEAERRRLPPRARESTRSFGSTLVTSALALGILSFLGWAAWTSRIDWRSLMPFAENGRSEAPAARAVPVTREAALPVPRRGEDALARARALAASGHLRDALTALDAVRPTDAQRTDADRLRGDIQRQILALTALPLRPARELTPSAAADREKGERRNP